MTSENQLEASVLLDLLGVGYNVATERQLTTRFRRCSLLAVDWEEKGNKGLIEGLGGEFKKAAVGDQTGSYEATVKHSSV